MWEPLLPFRPPARPVKGAAGAVGTLSGATVEGTPDEETEKPGTGELGATWVHPAGGPVASSVVCRSSGGFFLIRCASDDVAETICCASNDAPETCRELLPLPGARTYCAAGCPITAGPAPWSCTSGERLRSTSRLR